jgi:DNA-directed RNA polymerase subunit RPC12/RpoP
MTAEETAARGRIRRERRWLLGWAITLAPALWIAAHAANREIALTGVALAWTIGIALAIGRLMFARCPRCGRLFHSANGVPSVAKLFANRCGQCGMRLKPERVIYPSLE